MSTHPISKTKNTCIHGARGLAAMLVLVSHIGVGGITEAFFYQLSPSLEILKFILIAGQYGVEIFFMISGYLITKSINRRGTIKSFLIDRCIRLYPVFIPALMSIFVLGPFIGYRYFAGFSWFDWIANLISNLLFLPGVVPIEAALVVAWSLSYEAVFYLSVCIYRYLSNSTVKVVIFSSAMVLPLIVIYPRMVFFVVGAGIYFLLRRGSELPFRLPCGFNVNLLIFFALLFLMQYSRDVGMEIVPLAMFIGYLMSVFFGYLVFSEIVMQSYFPRLLLSSRTMQFLGTISYSLYIWHTIIMFGTKRVFESTVHQLGSYMSFALFVIISVMFSIIVSYISYRVLELKVAKLLQSLEARPGY
ncbi:acyltransferase family protein [Kordiimonas aquimaris]|uniref:acyltransferase family protein n=1 Tax=Kordiimonas aquimaris TaxID=707591 RepID=UPI0021D22611|nr:acyltransferase [Kordiimonas aquimaris]